MTLWELDPISVVIEAGRESAGPLRQPAPVRSRMYASRTGPACIRKAGALFFQQKGDVMTALPQQQPSPQAGAVVTKATLRAADQLQVTARTLATIIGISEATVSRMKRGSFSLEPGTKPFELAVLFVRLFRSLDAVVGGDVQIAARWLSNANTALDARPIEKAQTVSGLVDVIAYLDARRALV
jgi:Protein of unknown function (DUF2384)